MFNFRHFDIHAREWPPFKPKWKIALNVKCVLIFLVHYQSLHVEQDILFADHVVPECPIVLVVSIH